MTLATRYKTRRKNKKEEANLQAAVSSYLELQYPGVIFHSDPSGIRLTMGQAVAMKRIRKSGEKIPDMFISEPVGHYCGLYLELKKNKKELLKKDGKLRKSKQISAQYATLEKLRKKGYAAAFAAGFDGAKLAIDIYLGGRIRYTPYLIANSG